MIIISMFLCTFEYSLMGVIILYHLLSAVCITVLSFLHIFNSYSFMGHNYCYLYFSDEWNWSIEWLSILPKHQGSWRITIMLLDCFIGCSWRKAVNSGLLKSDNSWKWNIDILGCFCWLFYHCFSRSIINNFWAVELKGVVFIFQTSALCLRAIIDNIEYILHICVFW